MYLIFIIILLLPSIITKQLEIKNLNDNPILQLKVGECRMQSGTIKFIHPINLSSIETSVWLVTKVATRLDNSLPISRLVIDKRNTLVNNLRKLKPHNSKRMRRWDPLGTAWKWLAGSPDADDLRLINGTLNDLIMGNNEQVKINHMINERLNEATTTINKLVEQQNLENKLLLKEYDAITLILYIDTINNLLVEIEDTILRAKISLPNNKLLTLKEIMLIESFINQQGIATQFPEQSLDYVIPKVVMEHETLLYIMQVPQLENTPSDVIRLIPLIINGTTLNTPSYVIKSNNTLYKISKPNNLIQCPSDIHQLNDRCITSILSGVVSHCNVTRTEDSSYKLITENKLLLNNVRNTKIASDCGPHDRELSGNFLLTFNDCTVIIDGHKFLYKEITSNVTANELHGAFSNLIIHRQILDHHDLSNIRNQTIMNKNRMETIHLRQFEHEKLTFSILGGMSITSVVIIGVIIYLAINKRKIIVKVRSSKSKPAETQQPTED